LARTKDGLAGQAQIEVTQKDQVSLLLAHYIYDRTTAVHNLTIRFSDINPSFLAGNIPQISAAALMDLPLTGEISLIVDQKMNILGGLLQLMGGAGQLNVPTFWDNPRPIKSLAMTLSYDRDSNQLKLSDGLIDFDGPTLGLSIVGTPPPKQDTPANNDLDLNISMQINNLPMDVYAQIWPKSIIPDAREWIAANMSKGVFTHAEASLKGAFSWKDLTNISVNEGSGKIIAQGAQVKYIEGMSAVNGVNAEATFDLTQMNIKISSGNIGDLKLNPSTIVMSDLDKDEQKIEIPLAIVGSVHDVLALIDQPPLGYAKAVGLRPDDIDGLVDGTVNLSFPLLKTLTMSDIAVKADAKLSALTSSKLVNGIDISQGVLTLGLDKTGFTLQGVAALNKVPLQINLQELFKETEGKPFRQVTMTGGVTGDQWRDLGLDLEGKITGTTNVTLQLTQPTTTMTLLTGNLDMRAVDLQIDQLNWKKPADADAELKFSAEMPDGKDINIKSIELTGPQSSIKGQAVLTADSHKIVSVDLTPVIIGRTNASLHFSQSREEQGDLSFAAQGLAFDVSGLKGGNDPAKADPRPKKYTIKLDKLYTSEDGFIAEAEGYAIRDQQGWSEISLHGLANGQHQLDISLLPKDNRRVFSIMSDDFGAALKGMGFTDSVKGGKLEITGESVPNNPRLIAGHANVGSFEVKDLPVLAMLLNATSPFGFADLLSGSASFNYLVGKFKWQGDTIELDNVRAASTVGMNVNGKVDMNTAAADLNGTLVPFSLVNRVIGAIPLIGDVMTGGLGGGLLAVSYTIKGTLGNPDVNVNPVSILTPGFLRNIFFPQDDQTDGSFDKTPKTIVAPSAETNINK